MSVKRIVAGLVAMVVTACALSFAGELLGIDRFLAVGGGLSFLTSALVGGFVARSGFVLPALLVWSAVWGAVIYTLYRIAEPTGTASIAGILSYNAMDLAISLIGTWCGAVLGQHASRYFAASRPVAT